MSVAESRWAWGAVVCGVWVLSGCGQPAPPVPPPPSPPPFTAVVDMKQLMNWVLDPAADVIWGAAGYVITEAGEQSLAPTTEEGWAEVRNAAAIVAESGNLLMIPGRVLPDGAWVQHAQSLFEIGNKARKAAEAKDADGVFDAGGELYVVCVACHQQYLLPPEDAAPPP